MKARTLTKRFCPKPGDPWTCKDCGTQDETKRRKGYRYRCTDCVRAFRRREPDWQEKQKERDSRPSSRFSSLRVGSRKRGTTVEFTLAEYTELISRPCFYCEGPLAPTGGGLDRKDNDKPYTLENSVPACAFCNELKGRNLFFEEAVMLGPVVKQLRERRERLGLPPLSSHCQVLTQIHLGQTKVRFTRKEFARV
jgi:hypothetical protein